MRRSGEPFNEQIRAVANGVLPFGCCVGISLIRYEFKTIKIHPHRGRQFGKGKGLHIDQIGDQLGHLIGEAVPCSDAEAGAAKVNGKLVFIGGLAQGKPQAPCVHVPLMKCRNLMQARNPLTQRAGSAKIDQRGGIAIAQCFRPVDSGVDLANTDISYIPTRELLWGQLIFQGHHDDRF